MTRIVSILMATAALSLAGAASAQDHNDHSAALGGSMGTQTSATPQSTSASMASGAHHTPVAKAQRHHASKSMARSKTSSTPSMSGGTNGSGDMTPSGNANPTNQH